MASTGLNVEPGGYPVGHGTMCAYAALMAAPKATLIDVPAFVGTPSGGSAMGQRLSIAYQGIAQLSAFWSIAFTASGMPKYEGLVINNSWACTIRATTFQQVIAADMQTTHAMCSPEVSRK